MGVRDNLLRVRERVYRAALRAGRDPERIKIIAVSKQVKAPLIEEVLQTGITDLGENRVQELKAKMSQFPPGINWHMIGRLQTNKVKYIVDKVALIHSLDRWKLAEEINRRAEQCQARVPVLVQVNVAGEDSKAGLATGEVRDFLEDLGQLPQLQVQGLMTIAPYVTNPEEARPYFKELRLLARRLDAGDLPGVGMEHLSMGMSGDFEVAVEEGASIVRLGSAVFGRRSD